ncbi:hypothetical protein GE21DRAFT_6396 [Neurospora crassa]|uniref:Secreted protein n=1 Tax=Neurospora crassa (strain ATCC 24698 / 74-OR23-1A / CBS 708.71 / DSM 1257 / FGSC 987) TaxID=367110 RepID=V5INU8_NEUCR|nr:hypothetical protein NCU16856 [Neurospora crassa OR74A]ESA43020.1 hypothetical protein NCU16856 [Neurospora crassa OR74A]KHE88716.1 hypothetical protein GE21DRAFT_6396 [Neurospora crassa]|eukprot:XP_011394428.1 hypothetical protein NCU16856 [Neurospora crassa OR74A]
MVKIFFSISSFLFFLPTRVWCVYRIGVHEVGKIKMRLLCIFAEKRGLDCCFILLVCRFLRSTPHSGLHVESFIAACQGVAPRLASCRYSANTWTAFTLSFCLP